MESARWYSRTQELPPPVAAPTIPAAGDAAGSGPDSGMSMAVGTLATTSDTSVSAAVSSPDAPSGSTMRAPVGTSMGLPTGGAAEPSSAVGSTTVSAASDVIVTDPDSTT